MSDRNDLRQYDALAGEWWDPRGRFALLQWIVAARARLVPPPSRPGAMLVDLACGAGLLAPWVSGYRHVGVDVTTTALVEARRHGVTVVRADARRVPLRTGCADVVVAGECLEHLTDMTRAVAEACRLLRPGGTLVVDSIAATMTARLLAIHVAERLPGGPPRRLHDPALLVDRSELVDACRQHGVELRLHGLRPSLSAWLAWLAGRRTAGTVVRTRWTGVLFVGVGTKQAEERDETDQGEADGRITQP